MKEARYTKLYFEAYAKYSLQYNYDDIFLKLRKSECPDFKSNKYDIGLEVTRAISRNDGKVWSYINQYYGRAEKGQALKNEIDTSYKGRYKSRYGLVADTAYFSSDLNDEQIVEKVMETMNRKLFKLNNIYKIFENNYLYIFGETGLFDSEMIEKIKNKIIELDYQKKYDVIFINAIDRIFVIDLTEDSVEETNIDDDVHRLCQKKAQKISAEWEKKK